MGLDDLIQEGLVCYALCRHKYGDVVENRRHFMALVQTTYIRRITDLANERTGTNEIAVSQVAAEGKELTALEFLAGGYAGDAELATDLGNAPAAVLGYLKLLSTQAGQEALDKPLRRRADGTRETFYERLEALLGMPVDDVREQLRTLLAA